MSKKKGGVGGGGGGGGAGGRPRGRGRDVSQNKNKKSKYYKTSLRLVLVTFKKKLRGDRGFEKFVLFCFVFAFAFATLFLQREGRGGGKWGNILRGGLKMFVVMFVLFVFAILCLCLFSFFRSLTKAMCEL